MCSPAIAAAGTQVVGNVAGYFGERRVAAETTAAEMDGSAIQLNTIAERGAQIQKNATDQMNERARAALIERGRLDAMGGDGGGGRSWDHIYASSYASEGRDIAAIESNRVSTQKQNLMDAEGVRATTKSRLAQIRRPNLLTLAGNLAGSAATYKTLSK